MIHLPFRDDNISDSENKMIVVLCLQNTEHFQDFFGLFVLLLAF